MAIQISMIPVFVSEQGRALEFYRDKLGLHVVMNDAYSGFGVDERRLRWITVAPEPGETMFILYQPEMMPGNEEMLRARIGQWTGIVLQSDDVQRTYEEWSGRGVQFQGPPRRQPWGGEETIFTDPDGNSFHLGSAI